MRVLLLGSSNDTGSWVRQTEKKHVLAGERLEAELGEPVEWDGHTFEFVEVVNEQSARTDVTRVNVLVDDEKVYGPALTTYIQMGAPIPTPSVRSGLSHDIYLTVAGNRAPEVGATEVSIEVFHKPMIIWLWIGGGLMAVGTVLWLAFAHPIAALVVVGLLVLLMIWLIPKVWRFIRRLLGRFVDGGAGTRRDATAMPTRNSPDV